MTFPMLNYYANFVLKKTRWSSLFHALIAWCELECDVYLSSKKQWPFTVVSQQNDNEKRLFQVQCVLAIVHYLALLLSQGIAKVLFLTKMDNLALSDEICNSPISIEEIIKHTLKNKKVLRLQVQTVWVGNFLRKYILDDIVSTPFAMYNYIFDSGEWPTKCPWFGGWVV